MPGARLRLVRRSRSPGSRPQPHRPMRWSSSRLARTWSPMHGSMKPRGDVRKRKNDAPRPMLERKAREPMPVYGPMPGEKRHACAPRNGRRVPGNAPMRDGRRETLPMTMKKPATSGGRVRPIAPNRLLTMDGPIMPEPTARRRRRACPSRRNGQPSRPNAAASVARNNPRPSGPGGDSGVAATADSLRSIRSGSGSRSTPRKVRAGP